MLEASEAFLDYQEKYISGKSMIGYAVYGGQKGEAYTDLELAPQAFRDDYESGAEYMNRAVEMWTETGEKNMLPHPNKSFSKDKVTYVIPEAQWDEWVDAYKRGYEQYMRSAGRSWARMTAAEKEDVLLAAHSAGHEAGKTMWMRKYSSIGRVEK